MRPGLASVCVLALLSAAGCSAGPGAGGRAASSKSGDVAAMDGVATRDRTPGGLAEMPPPPPPPAPPPPYAPSVAPPPMSAPSPPPLSGPASARSASTDDVVVTGSAVRGKRARPPVAASPARERPYVSPNGLQSGVLTAGDHDDLLNPDLFEAFARSYLQRLRDSQLSLPELDMRGRVVIEVVGSDGRPVPHAEVSAGRQGEAPLRLFTAADGRAVFFPGTDGLPPRFPVTIRAPGAPAVVRQAGPAAQERRIAVRLPIRAAPLQTMDLLLVIDATGSMGDEIAYLQTELTDIVGGLKRDRPGLDLRVGLVFYRDVGDDYVVRSFPFTADVRSAQETLNQQSAGGGGDEPEAVEQALARANAYDWRPSAAKAMVWVADAPPHAENAGAAWREILKARLKGVQVVPVAASGVAAGAEYLMRTSAAVTHSRYLFLTDDSGVGLPHEEPHVDCYVVTRLDSLMRRVLGEIVSGRRQEASPEEIVRHVGDYDRGVCRDP